MKLFYLLILVILYSCGASVADTPLSDGVPIEGHRIFISSQNFSGNLGGLIGADDKCQQLATAAGLNRTYKAILSSDSESASNRILITEKVYIVNSSGEYKLVANSVNDFWDSAGQDLLYPVNFNEKLIKVESTPWTGTTSNGDINTNNCNSWTSEDSLQLGDLGNSSKVTSYWLEGTSDSCDSEYPIYCISQEE